MPKPRKQQEILKDETLTIRLRGEQKRRLVRAAEIESQRRPARIEAGPLLVELGMPGVDAILASADKAA